MCYVQMTALHWCAYNNNIDGVKTLLKAVSSCFMMLKWSMTILKSILIQSVMILLK